MNADQLSDLQNDSVETASPEARKVEGPTRGAHGWIPVAFAILAIAPVVGLLIDGLTFRWNDEDAFINFRIVRNLLAGDGLVYNLGERVEAGTSPLWVALLALARAIRLPLEQTAAYGGIALAVLGLFFAIDGAARATSAPNSTLATRLKEPSLPVGAAIFATIPVAWDYASSGLETGLSIAWLGGAYAAVSMTLVRPAGARTREALTAVLLGLGPLVRPEFALYSAVLFGVFACALIESSTFRGALPRIVMAAGFAAIIPASYQFFRMGYFASVVPNTAIAKEAFLANWEQGMHYFQNFFATYRLAVPLGFAAVLWLIQVRAAALGPTASIARVGFIALPVIAGAVHVLYLVRIGGDYMHGRLLLPATFAVLMPVARVPISLGGPLVRRAKIALSLAVVPWIVYCAAFLRVGVENEYEIGDERGWYARESKVRNPIRLSDFKAHSFYSGATSAESHLREHCPKMGPDCRLVYLDDGKITRPIAATVDPRIESVVSFGAIGIAGYALSSRFEVVDRHGLADPLVSHFKLGQRGRPGHEKKLTDDWESARYAAPDRHEETAVTAARHALACGSLRDLNDAVKGPITLEGFLANLTHASSYSKLRVPTDPFDAEELFCHTAHRPEAVTGGEGGAAFRAICREGAGLAGLRGTWKSADNAIASVQPICDLPDERGGAESTPGERTAPLFGEAADMPFEVTCPIGSVVTALRGRSNNWVRSVSVACASAGESSTSVRAGAEMGNEYVVRCPEGHRVIGLAGHAGSLIDGLGVVCTP